jgi:hypothetical protein
MKWATNPNQTKHERKTKPKNQSLLLYFLFAQILVNNPQRNWIEAKPERDLRDGRWNFLESMDLVADRAVAAPTPWSTLAILSPPPHKTKNRRHRETEREKEKLQCREEVKGCEFIRENSENGERKRMGGETKACLCVCVVRRTGLRCSP